jgi:hypothetical protein
MQAGGEKTMLTPAFSAVYTRKAARTRLRASAKGCQTSLSKGILSNAAETYTYSLLV